MQKHQLALHLFLLLPKIMINIRVQSPAMLESNIYLDNSTTTLKEKEKEGGLNNKLTDVHYFSNQQ